MEGSDFAEAILWICLLIVAGCFFLAALALFGLLRWGSPFLPSTWFVTRKMVEFAGIRRGERVYDLGCGDGRLLIEAARRYEADAIGIEASIPVYLLARLRIRLARAPVILIYGDLFEFDFSDADVVFCYLMPNQMKKLQNRLERLKKGCRIISHKFEIPGRKPDEKVEVEGKNSISILYKYRA
jgi:SAM-dependent methyltransferase